MAQRRRSIPKRTTVTRQALSWLFVALTVNTLTWAVAESPLRTDRIRPAQATWQRPSLLQPPTNSQLDSVFNYLAYSTKVRLRSAGELVPEPIEECGILWRFR